MTSLLRSRGWLPLLFFIGLFFLFNQSYGQLSVTILKVDLSCNGSNDGSANAMPSGGTSPYTYNWSNTANTQSLTNLAAGTYTLTLSDNLGATVVDSVIINQPSAITTTVQLDSNASCFNSTDGGATVQASGGTPPYTYAWSNSSTSAFLTNVGFGLYDVTVTDFQGCTATDLAIINSNDITPPTAITQNASVYLDPAGQVTVIPSDIDNGSNDNCSIANLQVLNGNLDCTDIGANTVRLIAIDADGNRDTAAATVTVLDTIPPTIITKDDTIFLNRFGAGSITVSDINNGSSDNCGGFIFIAKDTDLSIMNQLFYDCSEIGVNTVWLHFQGDSAMATVTVLDTISKDTIAQTQTSCGSFFWDRSGLTYTTSGNYFDTLRNSIGCDTAYYQLDLTINQPTSAMDVQVACDSLVWIDGITYFSNNNTATFNLTNSIGCDSVVTLDLTINSSTSSTESATACVSYTWAQNGNTYTKTGMYTDVLTNSIGCDSTIILDLEIRDLDLRIVNTGDSLFAFEDHPQASYQWYSCDGDSVISAATRRGYKPDTTGSYKLIVDNGVCSDTSNCVYIFIIGIDELNAQQSNFKVYPNPTTDHFFFKTSNFNEDEFLIIYDLHGKEVMRQTISERNTLVQTSDWNQGIYYLSYKGEVKKIVVAN